MSRMILKELEEESSESLINTVNFQLAALKTCILDCKTATTYEEKIEILECMKAWIDMYNLPPLRILRDRK